MVIKQARILIFGGTGSLGKKLIERFKLDNEVHVYSRDEAKHWTIRNEISSHPGSNNVHFHVGDVRDERRVRDVFTQVIPQIVIVAAALKQVDTCERSPSESILTNLIGTQNIVSVANDFALLPVNKLRTLLFVSTDKACAPVNVYGMCKAVSERIVTSQQHMFQTSFVVTRYGNVLESRGSIIPLFKYQAEHQKHLTVTDPEMTRFLMTLDDSVDLIVSAITKGRSGQTWVPRLPAMKIGDLAGIFSEKYSKPVKMIGLRPGEKQHEDLVNESESVRTFVSDDEKNYIIGPSCDPGDATKRFTYSSSQNVMSRSDLHTYLNKLGIIDRPLEDFRGRAIEEIVKTQ